MQPQPFLRCGPRKHVSCSFLLIHLMLILKQCVCASPANGGSGGMTLRLRQPNGSMIKMTVPNQQEETMTLSQLLQTIPSSTGTEEQTSYEVRLGPLTASERKQPLDKTKTMSELGLRHGSLLYLSDPNAVATKGNITAKEKEEKQAKERISSPSSFDPFPELARPRYSSASRKARASANRKRGMSYSDVEKMTSALHKVETQDEGAVKRIYMCSEGADRFQRGCVVRKKKVKTTPGGKKGSNQDESVTYQHRSAILFGIVGRERADTRKNIPKTSLSTPPKERNMCNVVKVHAVWEPPQTPQSSAYDSSNLISGATAEVQRAMRLASKLKLQPVGWMYAYESEKGDAREDAQVPLIARDVLSAASIQARCMKEIGREEGRNFVTLALNAPTGETEAFQVSDQAVQMVAEGVMQMDRMEVGKKRHIQTSDPVVVDGKEVREVDCVLCLINTALLSHKGLFAGHSGVKSSGKITTKVAKQLHAALAVVQTEPGKTLEMLCDFNLLLGLSKIMNDSDVDEMCRLVLKWSRGHRKGAQISKHMQLVLESCVS